MLLLVLLTGCGQKQTDKLQGSWQLKVLDINGTVLQGDMLGRWRWTFDDKGTYRTDIAGSIEEGEYTLRDDTLTMQSLTHKQMPEQVLSVVRLDSTELHLLVADSKNRSSLQFAKAAKD